MCRPKIINADEATAATDIAKEKVTDLIYDEIVFSFNGAIQSSINKGKYSASCYSFKHLLPPEEQKCDKKTETINFLTIDTDLIKILDDVIADYIKAGYEVQKHLVTNFYNVVIEWGVTPSL